MGRRGGESGRVSSLCSSEVAALGPAGSGGTHHTWLLAQQGRGPWGRGREMFVLTASTLWAEIVRLRAPGSR